MAKGNPRPHRPYDEYGPALSDAGIPMQPDTEGNHTFEQSGQPHIRRPDGEEMTQAEYHRRMQDP